VETQEFVGSGKSTITGIPLLTTFLYPVIWWNIRVIGKVTLSSPCLWACFQSVSPLSLVSAKQGNFIKSQYEMLKLSIYCTRFQTNYSSCTGRSSENICRSSGGAQEKEKTDETQFTAKIAGKTTLGVSYFAL
jgi:hypothetical protein